MSKKAHPHDNIAASIRRVSHAIYAGDEERDHLRTVRLEALGGLCQAISSDGHRLAYAACPAPNEYPLADTLRSGLTIAIEPKRARRIKGADVASILLDSGLKFPDWRRVNPSRPAYTATIRRADLLARVEACERVLNRAMEIGAAEHKHTSLSLDHAVDAAHMELVRAALSGDLARHEKARGRLVDAKVKVARHGETEPKPDRAVRMRFGTSIVCEARGYGAHLNGEYFGVEDDRGEISTIAHSGACADTIGPDVRYLGDAVRACVSESIGIEAWSALAPIRIVDGDAWELIMPMRIK